MDLFDYLEVEAAEASIDVFIEKRAREAKDEKEIEAAWAESVRRHHARRREQNRELWRSYYLDQADRLERTAAELAASHRGKAEALAGDGTGDQTDKERNRA